ncbi:MAG: 1-acyl-sn-glycerol-3-phosphate acyltransferase [Acidimicrobiales bacterium]|nr:1-acyl-sn-glycerol-3-phosphate acyltransferase [Acidimicrobiales bacterium]
MITPKQWLRRASFPLRAPSTPATVEPPYKAPDTGVDFETAFARTPAARVARRVFQETLMEGAVRLVADPTRRGLDRLEHLDEDKPLIFVTNHHSHVDTPLLLRRLPRPWRDKLFVAAAADYFFPNKVAGTAAALALNAIPLERTRINRRSALQAGALLEQGWSMLIYPEGGRSPDGWGQAFKGGAAYLSIRGGVPVVPAYLSGTDKILPKGSSLPRPGPTTITFGTPLLPEEGEDARRMAVRIEAAVAALADEATSDWWQARRRAHAGTTPSLSGPDAVSWRRAWVRTAPARSTSAKRRWPTF